MPGCSIHVRAASETARAGARGDGPFHAFHRQTAAFFLKSLPLVAGGLDETPIFLAKGIFPRLQRPRPLSRAAANVCCSAVTPMGELSK